MDSVMDDIDVFISSNKNDYHIAEKVYDFLIQHNLSVFFSERSLPNLGASDYRRAIDKALDKTNHMVVVTSSRANVESSWVEAEWGIFVNEKRSGRKSGNIISVVAEGLEIDHLPPSLRYYEVIPFDNAGLEKLVLYLTYDKKQNNTAQNKPPEEAGHPGQAATKKEKTARISKIILTFLILSLIGTVSYFRFSDNADIRSKEKYSLTIKDTVKSQAVSVQPPPPNNEIAEHNTLESHRNNPDRPELSQRNTMHEETIENSAKTVQLIRRKTAKIKHNTEPEEGQKTASESVNKSLPLPQEAVLDENIATITTVKNTENNSSSETLPYTDPITGMEFVFIPAGCFQMGGNKRESFANPEHEVCLDAFYLGKYEVTQEQYMKVINHNPSRFKSGGRHPVENVDWDDVQNFIRQLNQYSKRRYRLPTEAEWEYSAAGGKKKYRFSGSDSLDEIAWYDINDTGQTHPVGLKKPNQFGLYDMSGNVWEWCNDWYSPDYYAQSPKYNPQGPPDGTRRVLRGGAWQVSTDLCDLKHRETYLPWRNSAYVGFRLALSTTEISK